MKMNSHLQIKLDEEHPQSMITYLTNNMAALFTVDSSTVLVDIHHLMFKHVSLIK